MSSEYVSTLAMPDFAIWDRAKSHRAILSFDLEVTARCNNDCSHCYINLPAGDREAQRQELSLGEIEKIADQAIDLGAIWCLVTGGEPLLRSDFGDLYLLLKRKGLLVSVMTNACLVTDEHVHLFRRYPPRDLEVTVYGVTAETYERVTRKPGSYDAFRRGLDLLLTGGVQVRLKAMAMRSNVHELPAIAEFCRQRTRDYYRFDPVLHLRYDHDAKRNEEIRAERLSPGEIVAIEQADQERATSLDRSCDLLITPDRANPHCHHVFGCGAGTGGFIVSYDGRFRLCGSLWHPDCVFDLRTGSVAEAWRELVPRVRDYQSEDPEFLAKCAVCPIINMCLWCPAHAHLETNRLDGWCQYFCQVAHARAAALEDGLAGAGG